MSKNIVLKLFTIAKIKTFDDYPGNYDIKIYDPTFYNDLLTSKTLGLGEAYMLGKFDTPNLELLLTKLSVLNKLSIFKLLQLLNFQDYIYFINYIFWKICIVAWSYIINPQSIIRSKIVGKEHYDLPNILYQKMLDPTMLYSCGYWKDCNTLNDAQLQKAELIMSKLKIQDGDTILEIGSGWGYIASTIAKKYPKCKVLGVSISKGQIDYCNQNCELDNLDFKLIDYRELGYAKFNKIYSVGMFEHVGYKNYSDFFMSTHNLLKDKGIMFLHTICKHQQSYTSDPWFDKYIFQGGYLPSISQVVKVAETTNYNLSDFQDFGLYYAKTLEAWNQNFQMSFNELSDKDPKVFTARFKRMWEFYLIMSKVGFLTNHLHLSQFVFTKNYGEVYHR